MADPIRIANCSGFFGDRISAAREMVEGGPIDVLTGDWLAELTMLILARTRMKHPNRGFARTFVTQMEQVMGTCLDKGIKVVSNAGGLDPDGCADAVAEVAFPESREQLRHDLAGLGSGTRAASLTVDAQDNVWVTDTKRHQVLQFTGCNHLAHQLHRRVVYLESKFRKPGRKPGDPQNP